MTCSAHTAIRVRAWLKPVSAGDSSLTGESIFFASAWQYTIPMWNGFYRKDAFFYMIVLFFVCLFVFWVSFSLWNDAFLQLDVNAYPLKYTNSPRKIIK